MTLNTIIDKLNSYEHDYAETKENFINNCKERRSSMNKERDDIIHSLVGLEKIDKLIQKEKGLEEAKRLYELVVSLKRDAENTFKALCELEEEPPIIENLEDIYVKIECDYNIWMGHHEIEKYWTKKSASTIEKINDGLEPGFDFLHFYEDWMHKIKNSKEFFSNSNNADRLRLCSSILDICEKLAPTYKVMRILHKLEEEDLPTLLELIGKTEESTIDSIIDKMTKDHEADIAEYLEKIKEFDVNVEMNEGDPEENKE